jgi:ATP-dependent DNA ligase
MLAASGAGKLQGEWAAEPKLDGWRAIVTVDPSLPVGFEVRSRTGRFITTLVLELAASPISRFAWSSTASSSR